MQPKYATNATNQFNKPMQTNQCEQTQFRNQCRGWASGNNAGGRAGGQIWESVKFGGQA